MSARVQADPVGLAAARQVSQWEIGDPTWASIIIDAYLNPQQALEELREEQRA
jgi:hypothetical protein